MKTKARSVSRTPSRTKDSGGSVGWMKKGSAIAKEAERLAAESERRAEQRKRTGGIDPNKSRFRLKTGESADLIILDDTPDTVAFYEHNMKKDGYFGNYESCPGEWENCPLCSAGDNKAFVWFLTVLDLRGYEKDDGTEVPYMRRLLPIKSTQATTYKRVMKAAMKEHGTIRGLTITVERDTNDRSANIGEPVILDNGKMYDFVEEDDLYDDYGHDAIVARNGDVLVKEDGLLEPFPYEVLFPKPDSKDIAKRWGLGSQAGSDADYDALDEDMPKRKTKRRRNKTVIDREAGTISHTDYEEDEDEDEPVTKRRANKSAKRRAVAEDDEEEDEDLPPRKTKARSKRRVSKSDTDEEDNTDTPY